MDWVFLPQILYLFNEVSKTDDFFPHISSELTVSEMNLGLGVGTLFSSFFTFVFIFSHRCLLFITSFFQTTPGFP